MCMDDLCSYVRRGFLVIRKNCSCVHSLEEFKGSAAECTNQNCGFFKELNKTQFCGHSPYTRGEPRYIWCCGPCVVSIVVVFYALITEYL